MKTQRHSGFTLLEILIATAILGILSAIAVPIYRNYTKSATATECANEVAAIRLAEEEYFLVNNKYFQGKDVTELKTNSAGVYVPSPKADAGTSVCTYKVDPGGAGIATQYAINAIPSTTGDLAGSGLNLNTCNYSPCP